MKVSSLDNVFWAAGFLGHAVLLFVLLARRRAREYPVFASVVAFEVLTSMALFVSRFGSARAYFLTYWITGFADYAFQVALIYEIAQDVLRPTGTWVRDARSSFLIWGSAGLVVAAGLAMQMGPPQSRGLDLWETRTTVFTSLLICELFVAMAAAANRLGLQRRSYVVAIGQGLTVWAFIALVEEFGHMIFGWNRDFAVLSYVREFVYLSVLVFWIVSFWLPEKARKPLSPEMKAYLVALHRRVNYDLTSVSGPPL